jgi:hypothetical protein
MISLSEYGSTKQISGLARLAMAMYTAAREVEHSRLSYEHRHSAFQRSPAPLCDTHCSSQCVIVPFRFFFRSLSGRSWVILLLCWRALCLLG